MSKAFSSISDPGNNLMIVDALNMCFSFRGKTNFAESYVSMIQSLKRSYKASKVLICCDKGASSYRLSIYPEYKQNRKEKQAAQTEQEKLEFEVFFKEFERALVILQEETDYPLIRFQGVEADDIAGYICSKVPELQVDHAWLISSDRDWDLLVDELVSRFSYVTRKETTVDNWNDHYDCTPEEYISIKCLTGDTGDNVMGVAGIGPKRALSLVQEYGTAYDIAANIPIQSKYKYIQELNKSKDLILLNYKLMDIVTHCEEAIGSSNLEEIDFILKEYIK